MHPDLSPHLHSEECNAAIEALNACRQENPTRKFFGACNKIDQVMNLCLKNERLQKRERNREQNKAKQEKIQARILKERAEGL